MAFPSTMLLCIVVLLATTSARPYNADSVVVEIVQGWGYDDSSSTSAQNHHDHLKVVEMAQEWDHGSSTSGSSRPESETAFEGASSLLRPSTLPRSRPRYNADSKVPIHLSTETATPLLSPSK